MTSPDGFPSTDYDALQLSKPMRFGTQVDFHIGIAELKWLRQQHPLSNDDFRGVASKYRLPKDMLAR